MYYMIANEYGQCMTSREELALAGHEPLLEAREVNTNITSNEIYTSMIDPKRVEMFGSKVIIMPSDAEMLPLLAKRPTMLNPKGYSAFRLFGVEVIGDSRDLGDYVAADQIRVVAELSPALLYGSSDLYERIMQMHNSGYGVRHTGELSISRKKLDAFEIALKKKLKNCDELTEFKSKKLNEEYGNQIFVQLLMRPFMDTELRLDAHNIIMNCHRIVPTQMFALGLALGYDSTRDYEDEKQNARDDVKKADLLSDIITDVAYDIFGTSF